jgi:YVTN family beta-propeller protein
VGCCDSVLVLDGDALAAVGSVHVGPEWDPQSTSSDTVHGVNNIALSPDGTDLYVTERVFVVERNVGGQPGIARMTVPDGAYDVAVSPAPGERLAYTTHSDGQTVTVIDTETNTVIGTFTTNPSGASNQYRTIAVSDDGKIYVPDSYDDAVYASSWSTTTTTTGFDAGSM